MRGKIGVYSEVALVGIPILDPKICEKFPKNCPFFDPPPDPPKMAFFWVFSGFLGFLGFFGVLGGSGGGVGWGGVGGGREGFFWFF